MFNYLHTGAHAQLFSNFEPKITDQNQHNSNDTNNYTNHNDHGGKGQSKNVPLLDSFNQSQANQSSRSSSPTRLKNNGSISQLNFEAATKKEDVYFSQSGWSNHSDSLTKVQSNSRLEQYKPQKSQLNTAEYPKIRQSQQRNRDSPVSPKQFGAASLNSVSPFPDNLNFDIGVGEEGPFLKLDNIINSCESDKVNNGNHTTSAEKKGQEREIREEEEYQVVNNYNKYDKGASTALSLYDNSQINKLKTSTSVHQINNGLDTHDSVPLGSTPHSKSPALSEAAILIAKRQMQFSKHYYQTFIIVSIMTILAFFVPYGLFAMNSSCRESTVPMCYPKLSIQLRSNVEPENSLLLMKRVIGTLFVYVNDAEIDLKQATVDNVELLSSDQTISLNQLGVCKHNIRTLEKVCFSSKYGLDFMTYLIMDSAYQFSQVSNINPKTDSVNTAKLYADIYGKFLNEQIENYKLDSNYEGVNFLGYNSPEVNNHLIHGLFKIHKISLTASVLSIVTMFISFFSLIFLIVVMFQISSKSKLQDSIGIIPRFFKISLFSQILSFLLLLAICVIESIYFYKLNEYLIMYAKLTIGSGFYIQAIILGIQLLVVSINIVLVLYKPWSVKTTKPKQSKSENKDVEFEEK